MKVPVPGLELRSQRLRRMILEQEALTEQLNLLYPTG
jgi:hypothetical protein